MLQNTLKISLISFLFLISTIFFNPNALCQQSKLLQEGINQYKEENFEEAIEALSKARSDDPGSTVAAFFLGLAYKQTMDYEKALEHLTDAVTLTPRIKEAVIELVDVAMQIGKLDVAKKWIGVAEEENILPAKIAFLKGLILTEEGKNREAAESFKKAKSIDPSISQAADIQIALSHMRERELKKAKESFQTAITRDPQSDLAGFARQYLAMVEERLVLERPFRFSVSMFGQYDDNMVLKPSAQTFAEGITDESSRVLNSSFRATYVPVLQGPWLFNAQYSFSSSLHQKNTHTHDSFSNSISVTPGYNFGKYALNLATSYNLSHVRDPNYDKYSGTFSSGPLLRVAIKNNQLLELFGGYSNTDYDKPALTPEEDRDASGYDAYVSWLWLFKKDSFLNLRYQFSDQNADGENWDNQTNGFSANLTIPVIEKVKLQLSGQMNKQDFKNRNTNFDLIRKDTIYNLSGGFSWECYKNTTIVTQYTRIRDDSNIGIYDYKRNLYTVGVEYRF
ncbi:tetratricopeptide repeat protein [Thermodesulfobacteriota bacterium]